MKRSFDTLTRNVEGSPTPLRQDKPLFFCSTRPGKPGCSYSTLSNHPFFDGGNIYMSGEHYLQSQKYETTDSEWAEAIRKCKTAYAARKKGCRTGHTVRSDWSSVRDDVMYRGIQLKAIYNEDFVSELCKYKKRFLINNSQNEHWGVGPTNKGLNAMGILLMRLRSLICKQNDWKDFLKNRLQTKEKKSGGGKECTVIETLDEWNNYVSKLPEKDMKAWTLEKSDAPHAGTKVKDKKIKMKFK